MQAHIEDVKVIDCTRVFRISTTLFEVLQDVLREQRLEASLKIHPKEDRERYLVVEIRANDVEKVIELMSDKIVVSGFDANYELNALGSKLDDLIGILSGL